MLNFSVEAVPTSQDLENAGSVQYLAWLTSGSEQTTFDVLLMTQDQYGEYLAGRPFQYIGDASSLDAGPVPASAFHLFMEAGNFTLLIDNSDRAGAPSAPGELILRYNVISENLGIQHESRWDLFIALMVIVTIMGAAFLLILRMAMSQRLKRKIEEMELKCSACGKQMPPYGGYCPHCGMKR